VSEASRRAGGKHSHGPGHPADARHGTAARSRWPVWTGGMAAMLVIGFAAGTWMGTDASEYASVATTADERARPPAGQARLLMDQGFETFGKRPQAPERARSPAREPSMRPTATDAPKRTEQASTEES
jgi:hypothetical protein